MRLGVPVTAGAVGVREACAIGENWQTSLTQPLLQRLQMLQMLWMQRAVLQTLYCCKVARLQTVPCCRHNAARLHVPCCKPLSGAANTSCALLLQIVCEVMPSMLWQHPQGTPAARCCTRRAAYRCPALQTWTCCSTVNTVWGGVVC